MAGRSSTVNLLLRALPLRAASVASSSTSYASTTTLPCAATLAAACQARPAAWELIHGGAFGRLFAAEAAPSPNPHRAAGDVPPGHADSDLAPNVCNIGLGRRRDLSMRQDLCLYGKNGEKVALADVLKGKKIILVGFPGGKVCIEKHIPSYIEMADKLKAKGVEKVLCVTVDTPENVKAIAVANKLMNPSGSGCKVDLMADKNGGLARLLGVELNEPDAPGPRSQRFAAIIDDGILLKLRVENEPKECKFTDCKSMMELWEETYPKL